MSREGKFLTIREAGECFQIGVYTLYRLAENGKVPAKRIKSAWRFEKRDLCAWIQNTPFDRRIRKDRRQSECDISSTDRRCVKDRRKQRQTIL